MINTLKRSSEYLVYFCGILLFASVLFISAEVVLRKFFLISLGGADEISGYILGICITWSLGYVLFEKMHIRIDIIYAKTSQRVQRICDLIAMIFTFAFISILFYFSFTVFWTSVEKGSLANTPLATPLWIPQLAWLFGFAFFFIVVLIFSLKAIQALIKGKGDDAINITKEYE